MTLPVGTVNGEKMQSCISFNKEDGPSKEEGETWLAMLPTEAMVCLLLNNKQGGQRCKSRSFLHDACLSKRT